FKIYEKEDLKEDGNLILFFGRVYKYKGLEYLIKAEPLITKEVPEAKIVIAGTGEGFKKYENMMIHRDNFIVHSRYISYKEGAKLFQRCSLVALPYIDASQSGVIPTAYGFKKPVVVTKVGSIPEIVDDGLTGFIVPPKNPEALADAIIKLLKDEKLRKKMGENAYKKLKTDLSWDKIAEETIEVYKKAINEYKNRWRR
ncbi:Trehalose synthase, partial [ANME-1 cluster archaeon GoMg3.2]|nr:Trehalose synthase [ANME-1 cluster archaeon GoMg3.2]